MHPRNRDKFDHLNTFLFSSVSGDTVQKSICVHNAEVQAWCVMSTASHIAAFEQWRGRVTGSKLPVMGREVTAMRHQRTKHRGRTVNLFKKSEGARPRAVYLDGLKRGESSDQPPILSSPVNLPTTPNSSQTSTAPQASRVSQHKRLADLDARRTFKYVHVPQYLAIY